MGGGPVPYSVVVGILYAPTYLTVKTYKSVSPSYIYRGSLSNVDRVSYPYLTTYLFTCSSPIPNLLSLPVNITFHTIYRLS